MDFVFLAEKFKTSKVRHGLLNLGCGLAMKAILIYFYKGRGRKTVIVVCSNYTHCKPKSVLYTARSELRFPHPQHIEGVWV